MAKKSKSKKHAASEKRSKYNRLSLHMMRRIHEGVFIILLGLSFYFWMTLFSYHPSDAGFLSTGTQKVISNWGGRVGAWISDFSLSLFGLFAFFVPVLVLLKSWLKLHQTESKWYAPEEWLLYALSWVLFILSGTALLAFYIHQPFFHLIRSGGIIGELGRHFLFVLFNRAGSVVLLWVVFSVSITLITGFSWLNFAEWMGERVHEGCVFLLVSFKKLFLKKKEEDVSKKPVVQLAVPSPVPVIISEPEIKKPVPLISKRPVQHELKPITDVILKMGELPPLSLLNPMISESRPPFSEDQLEGLPERVERCLLDFGLQVKVTGVYPGPVVTRFELELAPGMKVSKVSSLSKDIARSLSVSSVRIVEVIAGKAVIGLEIPNEYREMVSMKEMALSEVYEHSVSPVSLILGKDVSGQPIVVDLAKMPHLLVAGTTGSGKSVSLNAMLISMLLKSSPDQLRLILIDPKMLELSIYEGIPHLLTPVITDMKDAQNALRWCVAEMDRRYRLMAAVGVRNLQGYNQKIEEAEKNGERIPLPQSLVIDEVTAQENLTKLPMVVVVIDELADMMMVVGKKVEDLIARLAQKARAAGIHLILATQRPSVDVITGLIKANIPTRIAFQVSSRIDSRTILDQQGAEQLLGHGDMLYLPPGIGIPMRVHGVYVSDDEVHRVAAAWRSYGEPTFIDDVTKDEALEADMQEGEQDPLFHQAVQIVRESRRASISLVQRRLRIGYNRAARLMEEMEALGIVSQMDGNGAREVMGEEY